MVVKEGIQITESAVKLAGLGAKNLAALLIAIPRQPKAVRQDGAEAADPGRRGVDYFLRQAGGSERLSDGEQALRGAVLSRYQQGGENRHSGDHGQGQGCQADQPYL